MFGSGDLLNGIEILHVCVADGGDDADFGAGDFAKSADFAFVAHAHFEHADLDVVGKPQNGQRQAHVVVEVAFGFANLQLSAEEGSDDVLGGRLTGAAGNSDHVPAPLLACPGS